MEKPIEEIIDICLEKLKQGISLDDILRQYPDHVEELKKLLAIAKDIKNVHLPEPSDRSIDSCLIRVGKALQAQKEKPYNAKLSKLFYFPRPAWAKALVFALIIIFISWGTVNLSAYSLPGDILYPIKTITERVKFLLTINSEGKAELRLIYSEERMKELVKNLAKKGELNAQLLKAMLDEASLALENISKLPEEEKAVYFSKLQHLNAYQKDVLEELKPKTKTPQREELDNAIKMCGSRVEWMSKMKRKEVPLGKWGDCCDWK